jgi:hypothetical protein
MSYLPEYSIKYRTFLKKTVRTGLANVFRFHPDTLLQTTGAAQDQHGVQVTLEFPKKKNRYPAVVVRFFERDIVNMGVGHAELILAHEDDPSPSVFKHYLYHGDLEFAIYALSSLDRDTMADTVVQTLTMGRLFGYTNEFYTNVYDRNEGDPLWNYINIDSDTLRGFGEQETPVPWASEDDKLYQTSYRVKVSGEFYSPVPDEAVGGFVEEVDVFPYIENLESEPTGSDDPAPWV